MDIEKSIVDGSVSFIQTVFFFLNGNQQSLLVSSIHYILFIVAIYYFFKSKPRSLQRILLFIIVLLFTLSYFIFNRCLFTSIELKLSEEKNPIQKMSSMYFGENTEGNVISKISLSVLSIIGGIVLLKDLKY